MTLLARLFALVAVALSPAIAIQGYNEFDLRRGRQAEVQEEALDLARLAAAEQQQVVLGIRQVLVALSEVPAIKTRDIPACNAYLSTITQRYPAFVTFSVADMAGLTICDTFAGSKVVNVADRGYFVDAVRSRAFTIGSFAVGRVSGRNVIHFSLPFYDSDSRLAGVLAAALSLDWLADSLAKKGVPPGDVLTVTDHNNRVLARYPENARFVGTPLPIAGTSHSPVGTIDRVNLDGVERVVGYAAVGDPSNGLEVRFGIDKARAFAAIARRTERGIFLIALSTSLVLLLTYLGARRFIYRPLGQLVEAANEWRFGHYANRVDIGERRSEIARVGEAFNTMAIALCERERELRAAKEKADEAAARILTVFESTTDSVVLVDRDWRISYLNLRAKVQLGEDGDRVGMTLWEAFPELLETAVYRRFEGGFGQRPESFEIFSVRRNAWFEVNAFPSRQGLAIYFRDVTEHKHTLATRRQAEERLHQSQKMEAIGQLTSGVAHDFNNLLMVVCGNLALIEDHAKDNDRIGPLAVDARQAADRGARLTSQLLTFSRQQSLNPQLVYADQLIRDFESLICRAVGEDCDIALIGEESLWPCSVDPAQLETALLNLVINARDAMSGGGIVTIELRNVLPGESSATVSLSGPCVGLSVSDTGSGMSPETVERAFEPFFTTKEVGRGTGLGLSMVYSFVKQSHGEVAVESAVGVGTTVTLYLPKATPQPVDEAKTDAEPLPASARRVLVVEDDEQILRLISSMLTDLGHQVFLARNGAEAIAILRGDLGLDLMISDVVMPHGMTGVELAREARKLRNDLKVLLASGYAGEVLARLRAVDEFPIIRKPFYRADLARSLRTVLHEA